MRGWDACVARVLFISLPFWGNTPPPHPAGDPKGPPIRTNLREMTKQGLI